MTTGTYRPNQAGWAQIAQNPKLRAALRAKAEKAKERAEELAQDFRRTGEYAESFQVEEDTIEFAGRERAVARVRNTSPHAAAVEWGNEHVHHPHRVLGRVLDELGDL